MLVAKHRTRNGSLPRDADSSGPKRDLRGSLEPAPDEPAWLTYGLRLWFTLMFGWTLWVTQPLWTAHAEPPLLPVVDSPLTQFDFFGEALFAAFAAAVVWPRLGLGAYVVVAAAAMFADQTRMQPQMFSFGLLMLGTWKRPAAKLIARTHLASLWFFSGAHKLFSPGYYSLVAPWLWQGIMPVERHPELAAFSAPFGAGLALIEIAMGTAVWFPRLRPIVAWFALGMHIGIVALLSHLNGWNTSVWGWNLAIAAAAFLFIGRWREPVSDDLARCGRRPGAAAALLFVSPLLFYVGSLDAYLCHCLYSANVASAEFRPGDGRLPYMLNWIGQPLNVPLPPAHRLFEAYFRAVAKPGDRLVVRDPRWWAKATINDYYEWRCEPDGSCIRTLDPQPGKQSE